MNTFSLKEFLNKPLYQYGKTKVNWLKSILPIIIIIHHICYRNITYDLKYRNIYVTQRET